MSIWSKAWFFLRNTKNRKNRLIPLNDNMKSIFSQYLWYRARLKADGLDIPSGRSLSRQTAQNLRQLCIQQVQGNSGEMRISHLGHNQGPRLHDIRHTFAVHSLQHMVESGLDIYTALPILSVLLDTPVYMLRKIMSDSPSSYSLTL